MNQNLLETDDFVETSDDTREILRKAVGDVEFHDPERLETLLLSLYEEAVALET